MQALVEKIESIAPEQVGNKSSKQGGNKKTITKTITKDWLKDRGIKALRDPVFERLLLETGGDTDLEPSGHQAAPQTGVDTESDTDVHGAPEHGSGRLHGDRSDKSNTPAKQPAGDAVPASSHRRYLNGSNSRGGPSAGADGGGLGGSGGNGRGGGIEVASGGAEDGDGGKQGYSSDFSDWSDADSNFDEILERSARSEVQCIRTNLCTILKEAVIPMASVRFAQIAASPTLQELQNKAGLLLTPLDFDNETALSYGSCPNSNNFWFKFSRTDLKADKPEDCDVSSKFPECFSHKGKDGLMIPRPTNQNEPEQVKVYRKEFERYLRYLRLRPILKTIHEISQEGQVKTKKGAKLKGTETRKEEPKTADKKKLSGKKRKADAASEEEESEDREVKPTTEEVSEKKSEDKSGMVLTCGIGIIRKKLEDGKVINCPLLEIDLCCRTDPKTGHFEFSPDYQYLDGLDDETCNTKIRLCSSLYRLEESEHLVDHKLQLKAQKKLDHWVKSRNRGGKGSINPFDSKTYKSLLKRIGRELDGAFRKCKAWDEITQADKDFLLSDDDTPNVLEIYDSWIIFQRKKQDASRIVAQDAQRFLEKLRSSSEIIPQLWTPITTETKWESQVPVDKEFLLPLKQNKDQLDILRSLETNDCVLVQGAPGTGKSHTIGEQYFSFLFLGNIITMQIIFCLVTGVCELSNTEADHYHYY